MNDYSNIFTAMISEDGTIYQASTGRQRQAVGIDSQREQDYIKQIAEMQGVIDNYYTKLVELGAIIPQKTAEDIAREQAIEQAEINKGLMSAIQDLTAKVSELSSKSNDTPTKSVETSNIEDKSIDKRDAKGRFTKEVA